MKSIGFRCWKDKFSYIILSGTQENPIIISQNHLSLPKSSSRAEQLAWFRKEILEIMDTKNIDAAIFKATETISRTKEPQRGELEGILQEAIFSHPKTTTVEGKIKKQLHCSTTARKAKYLGELLELPVFSDLAKSKYEEACIAAISGLPKQ
ncbi:hypothetical protein [Algoriella sp.]|uniref:hypothetical protein n=1 Tax=Algoriella sp. TaxID=1872434 RepID=UPI002FC6FFB1